MESPRAKQLKRKLGVRFVTNWLAKCQSADKETVPESGSEGQVGGCMVYLEGRKVYMHPEEFEAYRQHLRERDAAGPNPRDVLGHGA